MSDETLAPESEPEYQADALPDAIADVSEVEGVEPVLDIGSAAGTAEAPAVAVIPQPVVLHGRIDRDGSAVATGRRKTAVARVRLKRGTGKFTINSRQMVEFLRIERDQNMVKSPLIVAGMLDTVDVWVRVVGGGVTGQTGAILLGIARALEVMNPDLHSKLAEKGMLTRDDRMVERKKYGHKKARRSFQFSKR